MPETTPSIFSYTSYRDFLKGAFERMIEENHRLSYRGLNRMLGYTSPNFLMLVINGKRNLSDESIIRIQKFLKLNTKEAEFFECLVRFNQAESLEMQARYYETICLFKAFQELKKVDHLSYRYFSKWYYPAIREMTLMKSFKEDSRWIASRLSPSITPEEAAEALKVLNALNLVSHDKTGRLKATDKYIQTDDVVANLSLLSFHNEMITKARESLEHGSTSHREVLSLTMPLNRASFLKAQKRIRDFAHRLGVALAADQPFDTVYQLNFQLFNLTKIPETWEIKKE